MLRLRGWRRLVMSVAVSGLLFFYLTYEHHFPTLPDYVPMFENVTLTELRYTDEYPVWGSFSMYSAEYSFDVSAEEVVKEIEEKLRTSTAFEFVSVKKEEDGPWGWWLIHAQLSKRPRMPAGGGCEFSIIDEDPRPKGLKNSGRVTLTVFRRRPWL